MFVTSRGGPRFCRHSQTGLVVNSSSATEAKRNARDSHDPKCKIREHKLSYTRIKASKQQDPGWTCPDSISKIQGLTLV
ncbi:hypothetical protein V2J09_013335 [Rumex salicifolius]